MTVVAVTGCSGYVGRRLLEQLEATQDVTRVIGVDVAEPPFATRNLEFYRLDVRTPALSDVVKGADVLYHLAYLLPPYGDLEEAADVNVGGTRNAFVAAGASNVRKVVVTSSVMAYGAHPDNDVPLTEESPIRPIRGFPYSAHKGESEEIAWGFKQAHPDVVVTVLRPGVVMGPNVGGIAARTVESPLQVKVTGYDVPFQAVHESDVARALAFALTSDLDGAYNVAPDDWISGARLAELTGARTLDAPYEQMERRLARMRAVGLSDLEPSILPFLMYPWVMTSAKLRETGFEFHHSTEGTVLETVEARKGWVSVGRLRFRPRRMAAVMAATTVVAASVARRVSKRGEG